jgi:hypothetical protein
VKAPKSFATRGIASIALVATLTLGGVGVVSALSASTAAASSSGAVPAQAIGKCDQVGSQKLPKTRFLLHAGLAFGAFHRYIYKPFKSGGFSSGASGRTKTIVKAAIAGAFVIRELLEMDKFANADKTLCKIVPNIDGLGAGAAALVGKLKNGSGTPTDVTSLGSQFDSLQSQAASYGANIKDKSAKIPGL